MMIITELMAQRGITKYRLSKITDIPYATINDVCNGKARLEKCSAETIYKVAKGLDVSMETLLEPCFAKRCSFELFKSNVCHSLKELGDTDFIIETLESDEISKYYDKKWYPECLYLLAMLDYISRINQIPLCTKYDDLRKCKLKDTILPKSIITEASASKNRKLIKEAMDESIPEFKNFNIVENEVRSIV